MNMIDINDIRSAVIVTGLVLFLALVRWAWARRRRSEFEAAAMLPFEGEPRENGHE